MNLENWANKDFWSESELRGLCCGLEPGSDRTSALQAINEASEDIRRAVLAGALPCTSPSDATAGDKFYGHYRFFKPKDAMRWAAPKFPNFPFPAPEEFTSAATAGRWPWGNHHTELLGHLDAAARRFWVNYDPSDATTAPTKVTVSDWLKTERKVSGQMADSIASMLRPDGLPTGPRK